MSSCVIAHVDLDAFFAAVEQRDDPTLKGRPVVIGADPKGGRGRGVVSTCSYEARHYGIRSAMPISLAYQKCPQAVFLRGDHEKYSRVSSEVFEVFEEFTPDIEPISIDEAFLDITGCVHLFGSARRLGEALRNRINKKTGLIASVGIAPNKLIAKIASDESKPDGLLEIKRNQVLDFLWPLDIDKLWGVGPKTKKLFFEHGLTTIGDLAKYPTQKMYALLGENGVDLKRLANGIDDRPVIQEDVIKSVSHEHTFSLDTNDKALLEKTLLGLAEKVSNRLRLEKLKGKTLTLKVRLKGFVTHTHAVTLPKRINYSDVIFDEARKLLRHHYLKKEEYVRLVGIKITNFDDPYIKESLFEDQKQIKREKVHQAIDLIRGKFGEGVIFRAK